MRIMIADIFSSCTCEQEKFKGTAVHSARYKSSKGFAGKKGVVVGTANTGE